MSVVRLLVLGAIKRRGITHGYRVYRDLTDWRVQTWTVVRPGSIYHAISKLETQNIITAVKTKHGQKLGPAKTVYELTNIGDREFVKQLEEALQGINIIELSVGIAFMEYLTRERAVELLQERVKAQRQVPAFLKTLPTEKNPSIPSKHPELIRIWSDSYTSAVISTEKLIKAVQSGKYIFKNEEASK